MIGDKINLAEAFARIADRWNPRIAAELNGQHVKLVKVEGQFVWHRHEYEDELFLVVEGRLDLEMRDRTVSLGPGEFYVVPRGVEHRPVAERETHVLLLEPAGTLNTGDVRDDRTVERPRWLDDVEPSAGPQPPPEDSPPGGTSKKSTRPVSRE